MKSPRQICRSALLRIGQSVRGWPEVALRDWWREWNRVPELPLAKPQPDQALAMRMSREAGAFAEQRGLNFSVGSLSALSGGVPSEPVETVAAYIGEVIIRGSRNATWARDRRGNPGVAVGVWLADPFEWVERERSSQTSEPLEECVSSVLTYASDPTEQTKAELGWKTVYTPFRYSESFKSWLTRRRRRL